MVNLRNGQSRIRTFVAPLVFGFVEPTSLKTVIRFSFTFGFPKHPNSTILVEDPHSVEPRPPDFWIDESFAVIEIFLGAEIEITVKKHFVFPGQRLTFSRLEQQVEPLVHRIVTCVERT